MIPQYQIDTIIETAQIDEVIGEFVNLKKSGANLKGLSPFTDEKTPSFVVSPSKQIFKDFSSGKGGNVVSFLMEHEKLSFVEAVKWLAKRYNIEIEEEEVSDEKKEAISLRESLGIILNMALDYFSRQLNQTEEGRNIGYSYFKERGFSKETIETFKLGYSPDIFDAFTKYALDKGFKKEWLIRLGLVKENQNGLYDSYRGRVIFPIFSSSGRPIGFGARTLKSDKKIPKYLNSPESEIYDKSNSLYGLYTGKNEIRNQDMCYLVEGYTDVISLYQSGIQNVVSSSGTSLTKGQIKLIKRISSNITLLYDGDRAGINASFRGIDLLLEEGMNVRVALFPDGEDPDSFAKKSSTEELKDFLHTQQQDFISFKAGILLSDAQNDPLKRSSLIKDIIESIAKIPDAVSRAVYAKECADILKVDEKIIHSEINKIKRRELNKQGAKLSTTSDEITSAIQSESQQTENNFTSSFHQEKDVIRIILKYGNDPMPIEEKEGQGTSVAVFIITDILNDELHFDTPVLAEIWNTLYRQVDETGIVDIKEFTNNSNHEIQNICTDLLSDKYELHNWEKVNIYVKDEKEKLKRTVFEAILSFKVRKIENLAAQIETKLTEKEISYEETLKLLKQKKNLDTIKNQITKQKIGYNRVVLH